MPIPSLTSNIFKNYGIKFISDLANNSDSIAPMLVKDTISNVAIVETYRKNGGKDDFREKAIEEFGTGAIWLLAIPAIKKIIDKTIYPIFKLNPDFDTRLIASDLMQSSKSINNGKGIINFLKNKILNDGIDKEALKEANEELLKSSNPALSDEKELFKSLNDVNDVFKKIPLFGKLNLTNAQLYKGAHVGKFGIATALSAFFLVKIIKYKQKTTNDRIQKELFNNYASSILINNNKEDMTAFANFKNKKDKNVSFTGLSAIVNQFMTNPILNTSILDGVITSTRLLEARKGEKKEVAFKEAFQIIFIYALAKPIQFAFEKMGDMLKCPINTDPKVLYTENLQEKLKDALEKIKDIKSSDNNLVKEIYNLNPDESLAELLEKSGLISIKEKNGAKAVSHLTPVKKEDIENAFESFEKLNQNIGKISAIKGYKLFSVFGNIIIAAAAMGILQPKLNIAMRKLLNHGDHRNAAIVEQEKDLYNNTFKNS